MKGGLGRRVVFKIPNDEYAPMSPVNLGIQSGRFRYVLLEGFRWEGEPRPRFLASGQPGNPFGLTRMKPGGRDRYGCGRRRRIRRTCWRRDPEVVQET